jgi:hypothetical protein
MYLVELRPGKEELYRTSDDLALAIREGEVDARSRIYHRSTAKWISITLHPQYRAIVASPKEELLARATRKGWEFLTASLSGHAADSSSPDDVTDTGDVFDRWKRPLGLGLSGILLVLGLQLAFSGPRPPWAGPSKAAVTWTQRTHRSHPTETADRPVANAPEETESVAPIEYEGSELVSLAGTSTVRPVSPQPVADIVVLRPRAKAAILPRAPRLRSQALEAALVPELATPVDANSVEALLVRYGATSDSARARLETGMRVARLNQIFASSRLTPGGGVTDTRLSLAGAVNFIRVFRQRQAAIDRVYQDSVNLLAKRHGWNPKEVKRWHTRAPRKEPPALELLSGTLIASIDSMFGVLSAQAGAYKLAGTAITFEDPTASEAYGALRRRIEEQIESAIAAGGATSSGPTSFLLRAIGTTTLPRET